VSKIRRINFIASAGAGKSLTALNICAQLKFKGYDAELIEEPIKEWTYIPRIPKDCDSYFLQASQIQKEDIRLRAGVNIVVNDSPVFLQYFYSWYHDNPLQESIRLAALEFDTLYSSLNIFINREDKFYSEIGRYEKLEEAKKIDKLIKQKMLDNNIRFQCFSTLNQKDIVDYIIRKIGESDK
jgi:hypothetical protein